MNHASAMTGVAWRGRGSATQTMGFLQEAKGEPKGKSKGKTKGKSKDRLDFGDDDETYLLQSKGEPKGKSKGKSRGKASASLSCCPCMRTGNSLL